MLAASSVYDNPRDGQHHTYPFKRLERLQEIERYTCFAVSSVVSNFVRIAF